MPSRAHNCQPQDLRCRLGAAQGRASATGVPPRFRALPRRRGPGGHQAMVAGPLPTRCSRYTGRLDRHRGGAEKSRLRHSCGRGQRPARNFSAYSPQTAVEGRFWPDATGQNKISTRAPSALVNGHFHQLVAAYAGANASLRAAVHDRFARRAPASPPPARRVHAYQRHGPPPPEERTN